MFSSPEIDYGLVPVNLEALNAPYDIKVEVKAGITESMEQVEGGTDRFGAVSLLDFQQQRWTRGTQRPFCSLDHLVLMSFDIDFHHSHVLIPEAVQCAQVDHQVTCPDEIGMFDRCGGIVLDTSFVHRYV